MGVLAIVALGAILGATVGYVAGYALGWHAAAAQNARRAELTVRIKAWRREIAGG